MDKDHKWTTRQIAKERTVSAVREIKKKCHNVICVPSAGGRPKKLTVTGERKIVRYMITM